MAGEKTGKHFNKENATMSYNVTKNGYTVTIVSKNKAIVSGGRLPKPVTVTKLLGMGDQNPKTAKNNVPTVGLSLFPERGIGFGNVCPMAKTCVASCLAHQGQGSVPAVYSSRVAKTVIWFLGRDWFLEKLNRELTAFRKRYRGIVGARLNMFSDIRWESYGVIERYPGLQFYDYTKIPQRIGNVPSNYDLTFSFDGTNETAALSILKSDGNVSVVFYNDTTKPVCGKAAHRQTLPATWHGHPVMDGGKTDWRPDDVAGTVVGLRLLAKTYKSREQGIGSGFAVLS